MSNRIDNSLGFYENALRLRAYRQELLSSNIANADTPHYKAQDFDFGKAMRSAMSKSQASLVTMTQTSSGHLPSYSPVMVMPATLRAPSQNNKDGNTVDMDIERQAFTENALRYEAGVTLIHDKIKDLLSAIQG